MDLGSVDHLTDIRQHIGILGSGGGVHGALPAKYEVGSGNGFAVGPLGIPQVEGVGLAVLTDVVGLGNGGNCCAVCIHLHQTVGVVCDDLKGGAVGGYLRVQRLNLGLQHDIQGAALCVHFCGLSNVTPKKPHDFCTISVHEHISLLSKYT